jgi:hypothetical protein
VQRYRREVARHGESVGGRFVEQVVMIATRRNAVRDGEGNIYVFGNRVCKHLRRRVISVPIVIISNR